MNLKDKINLKNELVLWLTVITNVIKNNKIYYISNNIKLNNDELKMTQEKSQKRFEEYQTLISFWIGELDRVKRNNEEELYFENNFYNFYNSIKIDITGLIEFCKKSNFYKDNMFKEF